MRANPVKAAIIGCGTICRRTYLPNLMPMLRITEVVGVAELIAARALYADPAGAPQNPDGGANRQRALSDRCGRAARADRQFVQEVARAPGRGGLSAAPDCAESCLQRAGWQDTQVTGAGIWADYPRSSARMIGRVKAINRRYTSSSESLALLLSHQSTTSV